MLFDKIESAYKNNVYRRADADGSIFYFSCGDFEGLQQKAYPFKSSDGHSLSGYFYYYDGFKADRIVIFEHGMGSGHRGYMKEIEMLARHGYLVFAYDHTGCMESGGETTGGFVQSLKDLNDAVNTLKADPTYCKADLSVVGHSWGGFSTLNITALHPEISHIVAISGFVSVKRVLKQFFGGALWLFGRKIYAKEQQANPKFIGFDAISTLADTKAKVLIMHSRDDKTLSFKQHFGVMKKALGNRENITFVELDGKGHNPNYTEDAVKYKDAFFAEYQQALKENALTDDDAKQAFVAKFDWNRMTKQDDDVWTLIFAALES
ncbi:MAG: alpha/beta fold hydrolase [Oscillospiraceae bacterium]|nr:alpha/beta fold hydrolase [Oscillospiraceae bacterium]